MSSPIPRLAFWSHCAGHPRSVGPPITPRSVTGEPRDRVCPMGGGLDGAAATSRAPGSAQPQLLAEAAESIVALPSGGEAINVPSMDGYAFILNISEITAELPQEIIPAHSLDRASAEQVTQIKAMLTHFRPGPILMYPSPHEHVWTVTPGAEDTTSYDHALLPPEAWRYFVVNFTGNNVNYNQIARASLLTGTELHMGAALYSGSGRGMSYHPETMFGFLNGSPWEWAEDFVAVSQCDIDRLRELCEQIERHNNDAIDVHGHLQELFLLRLLERGARIGLLGYFSIIESILVHKPEPADPYATIMRQIRTKFALLNSRFDERLDYSIFGNATPDKIWSKLYSYRSALAHGNRPDFAGDLQIIKDHKTALMFVKSATKLLLRQALKEPQLISALHEC